MADVHPLLGRIKDTPDARDYLFRKVVSPLVKIPSLIDYESEMGPIRDQGQRGSCVAHAACAVKEWQERKPKQFKRSLNLSEEWIYEQVFQPGGGAAPRDAMKLLVKSGVCTEKLMPYRRDVTDDTEPPFKPPTGASENASQYKAQAYVRLQTLDEMLQSLAQNGPFALGVDWLEGWFDPQFHTKDGYPLLKPNDGSIAGGHDIAACGYDLSQKVIKCKQSWGRSWGRHGFFCISFDAVKQNLSDSWATIDLPLNA